MEHTSHPSDWFLANLSALADYHLFTLPPPPRSWSSFTSSPGPGTSSTTGSRSRIGQDLYGTSQSSTSTKTSTTPIHGLHDPALVPSLLSLHLTSSPGTRSRLDDRFLPRPSIVILHPHPRLWSPPWFEAEPRLLELFSGRSKRLRTSQKRCGVRR